MNRQSTVAPSIRALLQDAAVSKSNVFLTGGIGSGKTYAAREALSSYHTLNIDCSSGYIPEQMHSASGKEQIFVFDQLESVQSEDMQQEIRNILKNLRGGTAYTAFQE